MSKFYVYQYVDEKGTPYYIGKGHGTRIRAKHLYTTVPPNDQRIIVEANLTEEQAFLLENELIRKYGRKIDGGLLDNIKLNQWACTSGWKQSTEAKQKISKGNTGKVRSNKAKQNYSKPKTKEHAEKIKNAVSGLWSDPGYKQKRLNKIKEKPFAHKGKPWSPARRAAQIRKINTKE